MSPLRWGIVSTGTISHDFVTAIGTLPESDHKVVAVGARTLECARKFAELHEIPAHYEGYEGIAKDANVDIVYIGNINTGHYEVGIMMLDHGKHLLCEKPLCMNQGQAKRLLDYAKEKKKFCMEAIWSRFFPAYIYLQERICKGDLGEIKEVDVEFGFALTHVERVRMKNLGGGTILDLGVYTIQLALWAFHRPPTAIKATGKLNDEGVDVSVDGELHFSDGGIARIKTSAVEKLRNTAIIRGTKGTITLQDFWCPLTITDIDGSTKEFPLPKAKHDFILQNSCGLRYEADETRKCILAGALESTSVLHSESLLIAKIQDELRKQVGVVFQEDYTFKM